MNPAGFPHSEILESQLGCQLLEAYRRLLRPSSAPGAKTSTVCPYQLDHKDLKDARVHYAVLKLRAAPTPHPTPTTTPPRKAGQQRFARKSWSQRASPDRPNRPTQAQVASAAVPSGPNSVPATTPNPTPTFQPHPKARRTSRDRPGTTAKSTFHP
jgi:hypothetical protein